MRYVGRLRTIAGEESTEYQTGQKYIDYIAIIDKESSSMFNIRFHKVLSDGNLTDNLISGVWASSLASAKKRIVQDTEWKSKDFVWEIED